MTYRCGHISSTISSTTTSVHSFPIRQFPKSLSVLTILCRSIVHTTVMDNLSRSIVRMSVVENLIVNALLLFRYVYRAQRARGERSSQSSAHWPAALVLIQKIPRNFSDLIQCLATLPASRMECPALVMRHIGHLWQEVDLKYGLCLFLQIISSSFWLLLQPFPFNCQVLQAYRLGASTKRKW